MRLVAIICIALLAKGNAEKVEIDVLYESLCPDSLNFINNQLAPAWKDIASYVNINFVPFGKSSSFDNGAVFECQHGPKECIGNKLQSCALSQLPDQTLQMQYVHCFMNTFKKIEQDQNEFGQSCAKLVGINWESIKQCFETEHGTVLQLQAEKETIKTSPRFVPTIIYNKIFNQGYQNDSLQKFRAVVCSIIRKTHPEAACSEGDILSL